MKLVELKEYGSRAQQVSSSLKTLSLHNCHPPPPRNVIYRIIAMLWEQKIHARISCQLQPFDYATSKVCVSLSQFFFVSCTQQRPMKRSHIDSKENTHSNQPTEKASSQHAITSGKENVHLQSGINVTNASTPGKPSHSLHEPYQPRLTSFTETMLHSSWKFLYSYRFLSLFGSPLGLSSLKLDTLESAMLTALPSSTGLSRTMSSMLADDFTENCNINKTNTQQHHDMMEDIIRSLFGASRLRHKK